MGSDDAQTAKFELARNNVIKTLFIVVYFIFICYLGIEVLFLAYSLGFEVNWHSGYYKFTVIMLFLNCTVNQFIYLVNYKDFQKALMDRFVVDCLNMTVIQFAHIAPSQHLRGYQITAVCECLTSVSKTDL